MKYLSIYLDEADRVEFWTNPPDHPIRLGVFLVNYRDMVDLDQSGFCVLNARCAIGRALGNAVANVIGDKAQTLPHYSLLIATAARVGRVGF
jgi:hypothetical protein